MKSSERWGDDGGGGEEWRKKRDGERQRGKK